MTNSREIELGELMPQEGRSSVNPADYPGEVFELLSIPAYDRGSAEIALGSEIGSTKQAVQPGDVLLSKIVPHIRRAWVVEPSSGSRQIASSEWIVFRSKEVDARYLRHFLVSDGFHRQFMQTVSGVGGSLLRARPKYVAKIRIPLPPLEEQRRIAAILDASHRLQRLHGKRVDSLLGLRQSMYRQLFGLPCSELLPLSSLVKITSGYAFKAADFCSKGVHVIRMSDLNGEDVDIASSALVPAGVIEGLERFELYEGDILLGMSGSLGKLGIVPCIPTGTRAFLNQRVAKISLFPNAPISRELLVESIKSREYIAHLERCAAGVAVRNVSAAQMLDFAIPVPSAEAALSFSEACKGIGTQINRSEQCIKQSSELQASLVETFIGNT
jgi:type I restriction enzyme S subunit